MTVFRLTTVRAAQRPHSILWTLLSYLAIALVALPLRVLDLGGSLTIDEINYWFSRSESFLRALGTGDYSATAIAGHPGVTTMWLGSAGVLLRRALFAWGFLHDGTFPVIVTFFRLPAALAHVAGIVLGYALLRRLLPAASATLAAVLWAADPFVIGYSRVLHVDALAATFATLSLLAACVYWHHEPRRRLLIGSGICAGLAILSKLPALALLPTVAAIAVGAAGRAPGPPRRLARAVPPLLIWGTAAALTALALWPALWADPARAYAVLRQATDLVSRPHDQGNFFLGHDDPAPGPLFYPVALVLRLTPWGLIGLLPLARRRAHALAASRHDLAALACFVVLLIGGLGLSPKKFNRYLIPAIPAVDILAAVGIGDWGLGIGDWARTKSKIQNLKSKMVHAPAIAVALMAVVNAAWWHPYGIAYYNPLLGGAQAGADTFLTGWGEGLDLVAAWLNQQPDITGVVTAGTSTSTLQPYLRPGAQALVPEGELPDHTGYVVVYIRHAQQGGIWPPFDQFYGRATPVEIIRIHGVEYAWIYQAPPAVAKHRSADFGAAIRLHGFGLEGTVQRGGHFVFKLVWEARDRSSADYALFAHLIGPDGRRYAQADLPCPTSQWQPGRFVTTELPLALPGDAPDGTYRLFIGLYDPGSGQRLPLAANASSPALDGPAALLLEQAKVR